jgi:O-antigen/teichoic acid export membrane protein
LAYPLITWQVLGDVFKSITNPENMILLPKELFTMFIINTLMYSAVQLISFWLLLPSLGLTAAPIAYAIGRAAIVPITLYYHYRYQNFIYSKSNWILIAKSFLAIILVMILTASPDTNYLIGYVIPLAVLILWTITAINREEAGEVIQLGSRYLQRIKTRNVSSNGGKNSNLIR